MCCRGPRGLVCSKEHLSFEKHHYFTQFAVHNMYAVLKYSVCFGSFLGFLFLYIGTILWDGLETLIKHPLPNWYLHWEEPWTKFPFCFPSFPSSFYLEFIKNLIVSRNRGQIFNTFVLKGAWHFIPWEFIPFFIPWWFHTWHL